MHVPLNVKLYQCVYTVVLWYIISPHFSTTHILVIDTYRHNFNYFLKVRVFFLFFLLL